MPKRNTGDDQKRLMAEAAEAEGVEHRFQPCGVRSRRHPVIEVLVGGSWLFVTYSPACGDSRAARNAAASVRRLIAQARAGEIRGVRA